MKMVFASLCFNLVQLGTLAARSQHELSKSRVEGCGMERSGEAGLIGSRRPLEMVNRVEGGRDLSLGSKVDLRQFYPQFSTDSHLLGESKINWNPLSS